MPPTVCSQIPNHSRSIKRHCCKPRRAPCKGLNDHLRELRPPHWIPGERSGLRKEGRCSCSSVHLSNSPYRLLRLGQRDHEGRDLGEHPGQVGREGPSHPWASGARGGLVGAGRASPHQAGSICSVEASRCTHTRPAHAHEGTQREASLWGPPRQMPAPGLCLFCLSVPAASHSCQPCWLCLLCMGNRASPPAGLG